MCGITGFIDLKRRSEAAVLRAAALRMADTLRHRGPDMGDAWVDEAAGIALGFRRLAILDLSPAGHQPMTSADGRLVIVYNGECYNFGALRAELAAAGCAFRGRSDTEVVLEGCAKWGVEATVRRMVGMFAFALWDRARRRLWLVRDRLGIKPLYYGIVGDLFLFGSELKALRAKDGWTPEIDRDALTAFLRFNYVPAPQSIYRGVGKLEPGCFVEYVPGAAPQVTRYWDMAEVASQAQRGIGEDEALREGEALLADAVRRRMVADVPLGALLSGGVDSTAVVALMQAASDRPVRSFTIGFEETAYDEAKDARAVARHLGTEHTELYLSPQRALDLIPQLPDWYDEPFADSSALPTFLVSELARRDVTVALSGDGGDEVFLGYNRYRAADAAWRRVAGTPRALRRMAARGIAAVPAERWDRLVDVLPATRRPRNPGDKLHKLARLLTQDNVDAVYASLVSHWEDPAALVPGGRERRSRAWDKAVTIADFAERMAFLDTSTYLPDDILAKVDRASMAVSLEVRVPLLDHRVVEFAWRLPRAMRLRGGTTKWLLRRILDKHVPRELVERPKMGFAVPLDSWLRGPLRDWAETLLDEKRLAAEGWFEPAPIRRAWTEHLAGRGNAQQALWGVLMAQAWLERHA